MIVFTSCDDGYPADMKIADLLDRHGLKGTFFVCIENSEGRPVLEKAAGNCKMGMVPCFCGTRGFRVPENPSWRMR